MSPILSGRKTEPETDSKTTNARRRLINVWTWVGIILLAGVVLYLAGIMANAIGVIVWTVVFVFILRGPVNWLDAHGINRTAGTLPPQRSGSADTGRTLSGSVR